MSTALVKPPLAMERHSYTQDELTLITRTVAPGLSPDEFKLFLYVAKARNLDPLQRQIHAVKRSQWDERSNSFIDKMTIQTGIDGYRAIANRTGLYMPSDKLPLVEGQGDKDLRVTVWVKKWSANDSQWHEFGATAYYREFVQTKKSGQERVPNAMWQKMTFNQLGKCAESLALRKGWPEELGSIYTDDEMSAQDVIPPQPRKQDRTQREVGTLRVSTEPNRGHGEEAMEGVQKATPPPKKSEDWKCADCGAINGHLPSCKYHAEWKAGLAKVVTAEPEKPVEEKSPSEAANPFPQDDRAVKSAPFRKLFKIGQVTEGVTSKKGTVYFKIDCECDPEGNVSLVCWHKNRGAEIRDHGVSERASVLVVHETPGKAYWGEVDDIVELAGTPYADGKPLQQGDDGEPW